MTKHEIGTREAWLAARLGLLEAEKELTRHGDEVRRLRQELPWVPVPKDYVFESEAGPVSLADLFEGRSQLLVYHFMFGPDWTEGCPSCSAVADGFNGMRVHLLNHDVTLATVSRAPFGQLAAYQKRMGWDFPWYSSGGSDFNFDFGVSFTAESVARGQGSYNYRPLEGSMYDHGTLPVELHGLSAFVSDDGTVYHTYSTYARGPEFAWSMWGWFDCAPSGRNEGDMSWFRRHDQYPG